MLLIWKKFFGLKMLMVEILARKHNYLLRHRHIYTVYMVYMESKSNSTDDTTTIRIKRTTKTRIESKETIPNQGLEHFLGLIDSPLLFFHRIFLHPHQ